MEVVRIGVLGAARIAPAALLKPARNVARAEVVAIAARDPARAEKFATKHGVPAVFADYMALIDAPDIDAIYNPLPNGLHAQWTTAALEAGKHVLCEKPLTANAAEAEQLGAVAQRTGRVLMEAFHWRYHPLAQRMVEIVRGGELGPLRHVSASLCFPLPLFSDIRYRYDLGGGALMDAGCYTVHIVRTLGGEEPEVVPRCRSCVRPTSTGQSAPSCVSRAAPRPRSAARCGRPRSCGCTQRPSASKARCASSTRRPRSSTIA